MALWEGDVTARQSIEERVQAIIRSGIFPALVVQTDMSEEVSRA